MLTVFFCKFPQIFHAFGSIYRIVTQIGSYKFTASFVLNHCPRCVLQEADSEMDLSGQNAYAEVLVGLPSVEGREGARVGRQRGQGLRQLQLTEVPELHRVPE